METLAHNPSHVKAGVDIEPRRTPFCMHKRHSIHVTHTSWTNASSWLCSFLKSNRKPYSHNTHVLALWIARNLQRAGERTAIDWHHVDGTRNRSSWERRCNDWCIATHKAWTRSHSHGCLLFLLDLGLRKYNKTHTPWLETAEPMNAHAHGDRTDSGLLATYQWNEYMLDTWTVLWKNTGIGKTIYHRILVSTSGAACKSFSCKSSACLG